MRVNSMWVMVVVIGAMRVRAAHADPAAAGDWVAPGWFVYEETAKRATATKPDGTQAQIPWVLNNPASLGCAVDKKTGKIEGGKWGSFKRCWYSAKLRQFPTWNMGREAAFHHFKEDWSELTFDEGSRRYCPGCGTAAKYLSAWTKAVESIESDNRDFVIDKTTKFGALDEAEIWAVVDATIFLEGGRDAGEELPRSLPPDAPARPASVFLGAAAPSE